MPFFLGEPEKVILVGHEQADLVVDKFFEIVEGVFVVFVNVHRYESVVLVFVVLLFGVEKTRIQSLSVLFIFKYLFKSGLLRGSHQPRNEVYAFLWVCLLQRRQMRMKPEGVLIVRLELY